MFKDPLPSNHTPGDPNFVPAFNAMASRINQVDRDTEKSAPQYARGLLDDRWFTSTGSMVELTKFGPLLAVALVLPVRADASLPLRVPIISGLPTGWHPRVSGGWVGRLRVAPSNGVVDVFWDGSEGTFYLNNPAAEPGETLRGEFVVYQPQRGTEDDLPGD